MVDRVGGSWGLFAQIIGVFSHKRLSGHLRRCGFPLLLLGCCCNLDSVGGWVVVCCGWVGICCGLVVVGALDCCGSPTWDVVVGCRGFLAWCSGLGVGGFRRGVASSRIGRCLKIDVVEIF